MRIIPRAVAMSLFAKRPTLAFVRADSSREMASTVQNLVRTAVEDRQILHRSYHMIAFLVKIKSTNPCDMPMAPTISRTSNHSVVNSIPWNISIVYGVMTTSKHLERLVTLVRDHNNIQ